MRVRQASLNTTEQNRDIVIAILQAEVNRSNWQPPYAWNDLMGEADKVFHRETSAADARETEAAEAPKGDATPTGANDLREAARRLCEEIETGDDRVYGFDPVVQRVRVALVDPPKGEGE